MNARASLRGPEALRHHEVARLLALLIRARAAGLTTALAVIVAAIALRSDLKGLWLGVVLILPAIAADLYRILTGTRPTPQRAPLDFALLALAQTAVIFLTGGVESPFVVIYIPLSLMLGATTGPHKGAWAALGLVEVALITMLFAGRAGLVPRTIPEWLGLEHGWVLVLGYAGAKTFMVGFASIVAWLFGRVLYRTIDRMLRSAVEARDEALEALAAQNRELVQLSRTIAHELKNPLASVHGLVQLLERGGTNSEKRFEVLKQEISRMRTILDELLQFQRPLGELAVEGVEVPRLMEELTLIHEGLATRRQIDVLLPDGEPPALVADPRKVKQALMNLLQNAIDASPDGGVVRWRAEREDGRVILAIEDSGPGFSATLLETWRGNGAPPSTKPRGNGIGLRMTRAIALQHGGELRLENLPQGGGRAALVLPAAGPVASGAAGGGAGATAAKVEANA